MRLFSALESGQRWARACTFYSAGRSKEQHLHSPEWPATTWMTMRTRILLLGHNTISTLGLSFRNTFFSRRGQCARYMFLTIGACVVVAESCGCSGEVECALQWGFVNTLSRYERCVSGLRCRSVFAQVDQFYVPVICFEREMDYFRSFSCRLNIFFLPYAMILS